MAESQRHASPHSAVNSMTRPAIEGTIETLLSKGRIYEVQRDGCLFYKCGLATTGVNKHAQVTIPQEFRRPNDPQKVLVHLLWWRYMNDFNIIPEGMHVSHLDADQQILHLTIESPALNESRKHCHLNGWYKVDPLRNTPRCPHWECCCTGPQ